MTDITHDGEDANALANDIFTSLTADVSVALPPIDLSGPEFEIPDTAQNPLYEAVPSLTEASLTSREVGGAGMFDGLMASITAHLHVEFEKGRITGNQYSEALISLTQAALGSSVQYLLNKDQAHYQSLLVQLQAQMMEITTVTERVKLETSKVQLAAIQIEAETSLAGYALAKMKLASEDAQYHALRAQVDQAQLQIDTLMPLEAAGLTIDNNTKSYQLASILPKEVLKSQAQIDAIAAEILATGAKKDQIVYETTNIMPAQLDGIVADSSIKEYQLTNLMPKELQKADAEISSITSENEMNVAKIGQIVYETDYIMPAQKLGIDAETAIKSYQRNSLMPKELEKADKEIALMTSEITGSQAKVDQIIYETNYMLPAKVTDLTADTAIKNYQRINIMPLELSKVEKQNELIDAEIAASGAKTDQVIYETTSILPAQRTGLDIDNDTKTYNLMTLMPLELVKVTKQNELITSEISTSTAKKDQILYETASILPAQHAGILAENSLKVYQLSDVLPAQTAGFTADTEGKIYTNLYILPAQLTGIRENNEATRAKTVDTRSDGSPVNGAIGKQIDLQQQQIDSFKRDSESKVARMLLDTWVTQKSLDEGLTAPSSLSDNSINTAMTRLRNNLSLW